MRRLVHVRGGYASDVYLFVYCGFMGDALFVIAIARYANCFILPFERVSCSGCFNGALVFMCCTVFLFCIAIFLSLILCASFVVVLVF